MFLAMAFEATIRPIVDGYHRRILADMQPRIARKWVEMGEKDEVILDPKHDYLMNDTDFAEYIRRANIEREMAEAGENINCCKCGRRIA